MQLGRVPPRQADACVDWRSTTLRAAKWWTCSSILLSTIEVLVSCTVLCAWEETLRSTPSLRHHIIDILDYFRRASWHPRRIQSCILRHSCLALPGDLEEERAGVSRVEINESRIKHCTYRCYGHLRLLLGWLLCLHCCVCLYVCAAGCGLSKSHWFGRRRNLRQTIQTRAKERQIDHGS